MWVNHVILALMGLFAGFAVSAGTFAFLIAIGVIPRLIGKSNTARFTNFLPKSQKQSRFCASCRPLRL